MKQRLLLLALFFVSVPLYAVIEVGDSVPNKCWKTADSSQYCLEDANQNVKVLLFNAGWCGPCNSEFEELGQRTSEFHGRPVTFISLSSDGWNHGAAPDSTFLGEWKEKHKLDFIVAGSPKDAGKSFFEPPIYIPNVAIVGTDGKLFYKGTNPGVDAIFDEVHKALGDK